MDAPTRLADDRPEADVILAGQLAANLDGSFETLVLGHQDRLYTIEDGLPQGTFTVPGRGKVR